MGITERRTRQKEEIKSLILDAAWKQIREEGCQSLSIRKVADAIEYSIPVIYSHFDSKHALVAEFVRRGYRLLTEELKAAKALETEPQAQLGAMGKAYCTFGVDNREYYQMMFGLGIPACEAIRRMPEVQAFTELVQGAIREVIRGSKHPEANEYLKFKTFWALLHGLTSINMLEVQEAPEGPDQASQGVPQGPGQAQPKAGEGRKVSTAHSQAIWEDAIRGFIFALEG